MNKIESWCKHLQIAADVAQKQIFWLVPDEIKKGIIQTELGQGYSYFQCSQEEIETLQKKFFHTISLWETIEKVSEWKEFSSEADPIIELADNLLHEAIEQNASDIHFEPRKEKFHIRFRIDGILHNHRTLPIWLNTPLIQRYKILSKIDIAEKRIPQDGSFSIKFQSTEIFIRTSTLPIKFGEKCVLRLLKPKKDNTLSSLNFPKDAIEKLLDFAKQPQGIFVVCGPTGSGKSSTLHAMLREIIKNPINISTVEDPIESVLLGANQVQINEKAGLTFAKALRSLLRQDPDVILVGEIRDKETAQIAFQAARTGHLVFTTLHANSANALCKRLKDFDILEQDLSDCLLGILSQRLVRKLCSCSGKGCQICKQKGYSGRIPLFEWVDYQTKESSKSIKEYAKDVILKGESTKEEIIRVLGKSFVP